MKNCRCLGLALTGSDLIGVRWGLGIQIFRRSSRCLFQEEMKRKPNKQKRRATQEARDKEEGKTSVLGASFSLIASTFPPGPRHADRPLFTNEKTRVSWLLSDLSKFQRPGRAGLYLNPSGLPLTSHNLPACRSSESLRRLP